MAPDAVPSYKGALPGLFATLSAQLHESPRGTWVHRRLQRGAVVSVAKDAGNRRVLLISRPTAPEDARAAKAWEGEVQTFLRWFGAQHWQPTFDLPPRALMGIEAAVWNAFIEPEPS